MTFFFSDWPSKSLDFSLLPTLWCDLNQAIPAQKPCLDLLGFW